MATRIWPAQHHGRSCPFYNVTVAVAAVCGALDNQLQVMCSSAVIFMSISQLATEAMVVPGEGTSEGLKVFEATLVGYVSVFSFVVVFGVILSTALSDAIFAIKVRCSYNAAAIAGVKGQEWQLTPGLPSIMMEPQS